MVGCLPNGNSITPCRPQPVQPFYFAPSNILSSSGIPAHIGPSPLAVPIGSTLILRRNSDVQCSVQRYVFPKIKQLLTKIATPESTSLAVYVEMPTHEQTVLSTPDGHVVAIFDITGTGSLRGIYSVSHYRVKINMASKRSFVMNKTECSAYPVGRPVTGKIHIVIPPGSQNPLN